MHTEIFTKEQAILLPLIKLFSKEYYLVGGTAIALHIGHRTSIDFDLFTEKIDIKRKSVKNLIIKNGWGISSILYESTEQLHLIINGIKVTFFSFPYKIPANINFQNVIKMPELINLAAMKSFAIGERGKWKDYVDLYFILKYHYSLREIVTITKELFGSFFNEKLFRQQLCYFDDIDYSEEVVFMDGFHVSAEEVKNYLVDIATTPF